ncbi:hypothetical protein OB955_10885 [Halobacteria archaeon AArc-m2/3/4]|uniref:Uncharacterized protein n=1 Tax=Natronoglomus mannanivorans TaxID=2979990 RepID=A0AAP2YYA8_9EURY|nr:hypothetical protein [Halobacteria archaeon AArc-xg1-1]MCU4973247.1 hypothetical protein [Halobacteria archaeon AArc-m2/3/4]
MELGPELSYYARELYRRLRHYTEKRRHGYRNRGTLEEAAESILAERADRGFEAGGHFYGVWPRDLCFSAPGLAAMGFDETVRKTGVWLLEQLSDVFYTDFHGEYNAATPGEGVDTFPALVILLAESGGLEGNTAVDTDALADLAALHRRKFFDEEDGVVTGNGSSWWDSAEGPREAYNTALLLAAIERLEAADIETTYTGHSTAVRDGLDRLWTGSYFAESRDSATLACDANVVPLYFGLVGDDRAERIATSLDRLETEAGLRMRDRPFSTDDVHLFFLLHTDYHYHVWPWNSFMYAIGLQRYGLEERARREVERVEGVLRPYGNFLEVLTVEGEPYVKRGYASAEDFTVAAALWTQYRRSYG